MDLRLVRRTEFRRRLNIGSTSFWKLQSAGVIPPPTHLPMANGNPGRLSFWSNAAVDECVSRLAKSSTKETRATCSAEAGLNDIFGRHTQHENAHPVDVEKDEA